MNDNKMDSRSLFFAPQEEMDFQTALKNVQEYISSKYSTLILDDNNEDVKQQIKRYISKYVMDYRITVKNVSCFSFCQGSLQFPYAGRASYPFVHLQEV